MGIQDRGHDLGNQTVAWHLVVILLLGGEAAGRGSGPAAAQTLAASPSIQICRQLLLGPL